MRSVAKLQCFFDFCPCTAACAVGGWLLPSVADVMADAGGGTHAEDVLARYGGRLSGDDARVLQAMLSSAAAPAVAPLLAATGDATGDGLVQRGAAGSSGAGVAKHVTPHSAANGDRDRTGSSSASERSGTRAAVARPVRPRVAPGDEPPPSQPVHHHGQRQQSAAETAAPATGDGGSGAVPEPSARIATLLDKNCSRDPADRLAPGEVQVRGVQQQQQQQQPPA